MSAVADADDTNFDHEDAQARLLALSGRSA